MIAFVHTAFLKAYREQESRKFYKIYYIYPLQISIN